MKGGDLRSADGLSLPPDYSIQRAAQLSLVSLSGRPQEREVHHVSRRVFLELTGMEFSDDKGEGWLVTPHGVPRDRTATHLLQDHPCRPRCSPEPHR